MKLNSLGESGEDSGSKEDCSRRVDPLSRKVHSVDPAEIFNIYFPSLLPLPSLPST